MIYFCGEYRDLSWQFIVFNQIYIHVLLGLLVLFEVTAE